MACVLTSNGDDAVEYFVNGNWLLMFLVNIDVERVQEQPWDTYGCWAYRKIRNTVALDGSSL